MMSNPFMMFGILAAYLYFTLKWGPNFMKNRKPFDLSNILIIYNIIQIIFCARLVLQVKLFVYICFEKPHLSTLTHIRTEMIYDNNRINN